MNCSISPLPPLSNPPSGSHPKIGTRQLLRSPLLSHSHILSGSHRSSPNMHPSIHHFIPDPNSRRNSMESSQLFWPGLGGLTAENIFPSLFSSRFILQQATYYGLLCLFISISRARHFLQNSSSLIQLFQACSPPISSRNSLGTYFSGLPEKQVSQPCK